MQVGTLVRVYPNTLAGTILPSWIGRIEEISEDGRVFTVSNGTKTVPYLFSNELRVIDEVLPVRN